MMYLLQVLYKQNKHIRSTLTINFTTFPVDRQPPCGMTHVIRPDSQKGFISSTTIQHSSPPCPWRLRGLPGQRLNLTLYDFSIQGGTAATSPSLCKRYALLQSSTERRETPICGGLERIRSVYLSSGHQLDLRLFSDGAHFLLHYEAVGCPRVAAPPNSHVQYNENTMVVICNNSNEKSYLTCKNNQWQGAMRNCSAGRNKCVRVCE